MTDPVPVPQLCQLEYLSRKGWTDNGKVNLLHPERYVERLTAAGKVGRVVVVSTGEVFQPDRIPDPSTLVPTETPIPRVFDPNRPCTFCGEKHPQPHDGSCLI
jgi:hypothetical protein